MTAPATGSAEPQKTKTVARAAVQMKPSMRGFFNQLTRELSGAQMAAAGLTAGRSLSSGLNRGIGGRNGIARTLGGIGGSSGRLFGLGFSNSLTRGTTGAIGNLTNSISHGVVGAVRSATSAVTTLGMTTVGVAATATAALAAMTAFGGFNRALNIENAESKLGSLGHNAESISTIMKSALASVEGTIFSLDGAATAATNAVAAGIPKGNELTNWLKLIADTATVANAPLDDIARVLNRVKANGRAFTLELNMLADRGLPIFSMLAEETGKSMVDLRKSIGAGEISVETLTNALQKKLGGAALASASTTSGAFANMRIAFSRFGAIIATKSLPYLRLFFLEIRDMMDMLGNRFGPAMSATTEALGKRFEPVITSMTERLAEFLDNLKNKRYTFPLFTAISKVLKAVYKEVRPIFTYLGEKLPGIVKWASGVIGALIKKMFVGTKTEDSWLDSFITGVRYINRELTPLYDMIGAYLPKILKRAEKMFGQLFRAAFIDSKTSDSWLGSIVTLITTYVPKAISVLLPMFDMLFTKAFIGEKGQESWMKQFIGLLGDVAKMAWPVIQMIARDFVPAFVKGIQVILPHIGELIRSLVTVGIAIVKEFAPVIMNLIKALAPLIAALALAFIAYTPHIISFIEWIAGLSEGFTENEGRVQFLAIALGSMFLVFQSMKMAIGIVSGIGKAFKGISLVLNTFFKPLIFIAKWVKNSKFVVTLLRLFQLSKLIGIMRTLNFLFLASKARIVAWGAAIAASRLGVLAVAAASRIAAAGQWLWNIAMTANPIGLVIAGIVLLVAGLIWFFTKTKMGKQAWASLVTAIQHGVGEFTRWLGEAGTNIATWWNDVVGGIVTGWNTVIKFFSDTLTNVGNWFNGIFTGITDGFKAVADWFAGVFENINGFFNDVVTNITNGIDRLISWVSGLFDIFPDWLRDMLGMDGATLTVVGQQGVSNLPAMATGGDIMGPTNVLVGEKEPETIVNRGKMNNMIDTVQRKLNSGMFEGNGGSTVTNTYEVTVVQQPWEDGAMLAKTVVNTLEFNSLR